MRRQLDIVEEVILIAEQELLDLGVSWKPHFTRVVHHAVHGTEFNAEGALVPWALVRLLVTHTDIRACIHPAGIRLLKAVLTSDQRDDKDKDIILYDFILCESPVPLAFVDCCINGKLSFNFAKLKSLSLLGSTIRTVHLDAAHVQGAIVFDRCFFSRLDGLSIKADGLTTEARLSLRECVAVGGVRLTRAHIGGDLEASGALLVSARYARYFWGDGQVLRAASREPYKCAGLFDAPERSLQDIRSAMLSIAYPQNHGIVSLLMRLLGAPAACAQLLPYDYRDPQFEALNLFNALISGSIMLRRGFRSLGEVSLNSTQIKGAVLARGAYFFQPDGVALSMDAMECRLSLYMQTDENNRGFIARGSVSLRGTIISHRFVCEEAQFCAGERPTPILTLLRDTMREREAYALFAKRLHVGGDLSLNWPSVEETHDAHASETGSLLPNSTETKSAFAWKSRISLENARIGGRLLFSGAVGELAVAPRPFMTLAFAKIEGSVILAIKPEAEICEASLRSATTGSIDLSKSELDFVKWDLEGLEYNTVDNYRKCECDGGLKTGVDAWSEKVLSALSAPRPPIQPYDKFMSFLRDAGDEFGAWKVGIKKEDVISNSIKPWRPKWSSSPSDTRRHVDKRCGATPKGIGDLISSSFYLLWRFVVKWTVFYGYNPLLAILFLMGLWVIGSIVFSQAFTKQYICPTRALNDGRNQHVAGTTSESSTRINRCTTPQNYPQFNAALYSFEVATPLPSLGQKDYWGLVGGHEDVRWVWYKAFHTLAGWFLSLMIVLSPTRLLRRH